LDAACVTEQALGLGRGLLLPCPVIHKATELARTGAGYVPYGTLPRKNQKLRERRNNMRPLIAVLAAIAFIAFLATNYAEATNSAKSTSQQIKELEARVAALEHLHWQDYYAVNAVSQRVYERATTCSGKCANNDLVLYEFKYPKDNYERLVPSYISGNGQWQAKEINPDQWEVSATVQIGDYTYGPYTWYI
jgi:hypothetical protein